MIHSTKPKPGNSVPGLKANSLSRRGFLGAATTLAAGAWVHSAICADRDWSGQSPIRYPDPDIIALEPAFEKYIQGNSPLRRLHTGLLWAEGPAWNGAGNYLVWSDIPNNAQMRYLPEDGHVSVMRSNSNFSNGNTFDWQGRQVSCEHATRRVARYESDGRITVLADTFDSKPFNAPNDVVVHPDGGIWFTDDAGETWSQRGEGMRADHVPPELVHDPIAQDVHCLVQCPYAPNRMWVQHHNGIFVSSDEGKNFTEIKDVPPSVFGFPVVVHPRDPDTGPLHDPVATYVLACGLRNLKQVYVGGKLVADGPVMRSYDESVAIREAYARVARIEGLLAAEESPAAKPFVLPP